MIKTCNLPCLLLFQIFRLVARYNLHPEIITSCAYLQLYSSALEFMLQCLVYKCELYAQEIFDECTQLKNK